MNIDSQKYINQGGIYCPQCGTPNILADSAEVNGVICTHNVRCLECGASWTDVLRLEGIDNFVPGTLKEQEIERKREALVSEWSDICMKDHDVLNRILEERASRLSDEEVVKAYYDADLDQLED